MAERASLPETIEACVDRRLEGLHTAAFGVIASYSDGLATVQPNLPDVAAHQSVPVLVPGAWAAGDPCLIVYCEREFDGDLEDAGEERRHGVGGPVAIPLIARPGQSVDFVALAGLVEDQLVALVDAIQDTVIVPNDGGASFKSTLLSGLGAISWPGSMAATKVKAR
jgi:hypothetical protein